VSGVLCLDQQNYTRAREIFLQLLPRETKPNGTRYIILNNIAYVDALIGNPELLTEADAYSKEAYAAAPWVPSFTGTRGTVLVAMGQLEAGIKLLKESFEKALTPRSKAENACHLTMAHARIGDRDQADNYLKLARQLDPQCRLIERAEVEFQNKK
jgi:tetratricopeptide (TPR) repeat protein